MAIRLSISIILCESEHVLWKQERQKEPTSSQYVIFLSAKHRLDESCLQIRYIGDCRLKKDIWTCMLRA